MVFKKVESLNELKSICQKPNYREVGNWYARRVIRDAALPITRLLLYTGITAHQVTTISLIVALIGIAFLALPSAFIFFLGTLLLQLWYLLDHVDGQIARYRKTSCLTGRFFDFITHHMTHGLIFFSLGYYGFELSGIPLIVVWGFLTSIFTMLFNLLSDTKYKTFFEALSGGKSFEIVPSSHEPLSSLSTPLIQRALKKIYSFCHKLVEIHVLMNILTVSALLNLLPWFPMDLRVALLLFYGTVIPLLTLSKIVYWISSGSIDQEFNQTFREAKAVTPK